MPGCLGHPGGPAIRGGPARLALRGDPVAGSSRSGSPRPRACPGPLGCPSGACRRSRRPGPASPRMPFPLAASAPPTPSSPTSTRQRRRRAVAAMLTGRRWRTWRRCERLRDDEVRRRLDRRGKSPIGQPPEGRRDRRTIARAVIAGQTGLGQDRRVDPAGELAQLLDGELEFPRPPRSRDRLVVCAQSGGEPAPERGGARARPRRAAAGRRRAGRARAVAAPRRLPRPCAPASGGPRPRRLVRR